MTAGTYRLVSPADIAFIDGREVDARAWALGLGGALLVRRAASVAGAILPVDAAGRLRAPAVVGGSRVPAGTAVLPVDAVTLRDGAGEAFCLARFRLGAGGAVHTGFRGALPAAGTPLLAQPGAAAGTPLLEVDGRDGALSAGTTILTLDGAIAVEHLVPGDRIITRDRGAQPLRWVERIDRAAAGAGTTLVRLEKHALGPGRPDRALTLTGRTRVLLRGTDAGRGARTIVPAARLADGKDVVASQAEPLPPLFRLWLGRREIVYADGLEVETAAPLPEDVLSPEVALPRPRALSARDRRGLDAP